MEMCLNEVRSLMRNLPVDVLRNTMALLLSDQSVASKPKSEVTFLFSDACRAHGVETFLLRMDDPEIMSALSHAAGCSNEELPDHLNKCSFDEFARQLSLETLQKVGLRMGLEPSTKTEMINRLGDELILVGMETILHKLPSALLKNYCQCLNIQLKGKRGDLADKVLASMFDLKSLEEMDAARKRLEKARRSYASRPLTGASSASSASSSSGTSGKRKAAAKKTGTKKSGGKKASTPAKRKRTASDTNQSSSDEDDEQEEPADGEDSAGDEEEDAEEESSESDEAPELGPPDISLINKSMDYTYLYDVYNVTHLKDYCKIKDIKASGKKSAIIKRILEYLAQQPDEDQAEAAKAAHVDEEEQEDAAAGVTQKQHEQEPQTADADEAMDEKTDE